MTYRLLEVYSIEHFRLDHQGRRHEVMIPMPGEEPFSRAIFTDTEGCERVPVITTVTHGWRLRSRNGRITLTPGEQFTKRGDAIRSAVTELEDKIKAGSLGIPDTEVLARVARLQARRNVGGLSYTGWLIRLEHATIGGA